MSTAPLWKCRPYRDGDDAALASLFERAFDRPMTAAQWRWKLGSRRDGFDNVWVAAGRDDQPVCHYGGMPRWARFGDRDLRVMVVADAMTAPEFRRQGAFTTVAERAHAHWRESGVDLVLGMPNEKHGSRVEALGWRSVATLRWLVRPLRADLLLRRRTWLGHAPGVGLASRAFNAYWDRGAAPAGVATRAAEGDAARAALAALTFPEDKGRFTLRRDAEWLGHRLLDAPEGPHRIRVAGAGDAPLGFSAYRLQEVNGRRIGAMVELDGDDAGALDCLVRDTAVDLAAAGAEMVIALAIPKSPQDKALRHRGFRHRWGDFTVNAILLDETLDAMNLRGAAPWVLSGGDFDVV